MLRLLQTHGLLTSAIRRGQPNRSLLNPMAFREFSALTQSTPTVDRINKWGLSTPKRFLNIHEYQGKDLMREHGVSVQQGYAAFSVGEAKEKAQMMFNTGAKAVVVKAQIHAGGRGKGYFSNGLQGGVHMASDVSEVEILSNKMFGSHLITKQTPPEGQECRTVFLEPVMGIERELYLAFIMDRTFNGPCMVASAEGGVDIETVAKKNPAAIFKEGIDISVGLLHEQARKIAVKLGFNDEHEIEDMVTQMKSLYDMFIQLDCTQVEINPLVVSKSQFLPPYATVSEWISQYPRFSRFAENFEFTEWSEIVDYGFEDLMALDIPRRAAVPLSKVIGGLKGTGVGKIYCLDAKLNFDSNAEFRQADIFNLRDVTMEDPREVAAAQYDLNYIALDGSIGCMVNGAGLAMATMDIISLRGGSPANFLDVGGGATEQQVEAAFRILTSDENVKAILVNIFGGIMKCDVIAQGIVNAARNIDINVPIVVRLEGTNINQGVEILQNSGIAITTATNLDEAAQFAVQAVADRRRQKQLNLDIKSTSSQFLTPIIS